jgi:hypothetical protein
MPPMRVPTADVQRRPLGLRAWLIAVAAAIVVVILSAQRLAHFYTDYLWFQEVGFGDTWRQLISVKAVPALIFSSIFFVFMLVNLVVADRVAPRYRSSGPEDEIIERYRMYVAPYAGRLRAGVALFFALVMGGGVSAEWRSWVLFSNAVDFGTDDPQFGRDIGYYVFRLPFLQFAAGWTFAALLVVLIVVAVFHYLNGGIRFQSPWQRVTPQVKVHLSVILALMAIAKTWQYFLARHQLVFSRRGVVDGATYTDVNAQLPALNLLILISLAAAGLFIANIFRRGWVFPVIAVGLWAFISLVVGTVYPAVIQRFTVQPNEFEREQEYIERNIQATREAFNLDGITVRDFAYETDLDEPQLAAASDTIDNIRLWDPGDDALEAVYRARQEFLPFYTFRDVDVDRYRVGDETVQSLIAPRELDGAQIPDRTWTNVHLSYTHGYGAVVADASAVERGEPSYLLAGVPPRGELTSELDEPGIYFGERLGGYAVVGTKVPEQQAAGEEGTEEIRYEGRAGVDASGFFRRAALALRFGDWNLFVSGQLTGDSRVLFKRDIRERVEAAAPFLEFDADPYLVVLGGRALWVIDAYTTTSQYPYSQALRPRNLPAGSGLATEFNYVRNSVKATVDAYDGTVRYYVVDEEDPVIRAYRRAFPELFSNVEDMPEGLVEHWRYPEDLFRAQTEQLTLYHMTQPRAFFQKQALWDVAPDPREAVQPVTTDTTAAGNDGGRNTTLAADTNPIEPLYLTMQLPGEEGQEFVMVRPFVPRRKTNQLSGFLVARSDPEHYGELVLYEVPDARQAPSPANAASQIESTQEIAGLFTLLDQRGSTLVRGNMQLVPIGSSIVYARPVYVLGTGQGTFPRLRFVTLSYGDRAALADLDPESSAFRTVQTALADLVLDRDAPPPVIDPDAPLPGEPDEPDEPAPGEPSEPSEPLPSDVGELLRRAAAEFAAADAAFRAGDLGEYQDHIEEARRLVLEADRLARAGSGSTATTTTTAAPAVEA